MQASFYNAVEKSIILINLKLTMILLQIYIKSIKIVIITKRYSLVYTSNNTTKPYIYRYGDLRLSSNLRNGKYTMFVVYYYRCILKKF